jgi:hypothetical protein
LSNPHFCLVLQALRTLPKLLLQLREVDLTYWLTWGWGASRGWSHGCGAPRLQIAAKHTWLWNQCFCDFVAQSLEVEVPDCKNKKTRFYANSTHLPDIHATEGGFYTDSIQAHHGVNAGILVYTNTARYMHAKYCVSSNHRLNLVDSNHRVPVYWSQLVGDYFNRRQSGNRSRADSENMVVVRYTYCGMWEPELVVMHFQPLVGPTIKGVSGQGNLAPSFEVSNPRFVTQLRFSS